jgi:acid phosphatase type 7
MNDRFCGSPLFLSPPVVQRASEDGFTVSIEVSRLCMGRIEWGFEADALTHTAVSVHGGLIDAHESCLVIPVRFEAPMAVGQPVFYRVVAESLDYASAYEIDRGDSIASAVRRLKLPHRDQQSLSLTVINDTHENPETLTRLARRIEELDPDLLVWNGDVCRHFNAGDNPAALLLRPGAVGTEPSDGGWASTRPLLYVPGNHDVRGEHARLRPSILAPGPHANLAYNTALRIGPLAMITLDSGEDKPDRHPVFSGTAAYEPYREQQAEWLATQLKRPEITEAPFRIAFSHIPLRGAPGQNDGSIIEGHARYSGQGARLWLPPLTAAAFQAVISGHMHEWRCDEPTGECPITQIVGGGPGPADATVMVMEVEPTRLSVRLENLDGETLATAAWTC